MGAAHCFDVPATRELVLGRYRPLRPLGSGGSGSVWLAHDTQADREVALKIVAPRGQGRRPRRAGGRRRRAPAPPALPARARARPRRRPRLHRLRVRRAARRSARRCGSGELSDRDAVEAAAQILDGLAHAHGERDRPPRREARERDARRGRRDLGAAARLRARAAGGGRDAHRRRRRARARSPTSRPSGSRASRPTARRRRVGRRRRCSGRRSPAGTRSGRPRRSRPRADPRRARSRSRRCAPTCPPTSARRVDRMLDLDPRRRPSAKQLAARPARRLRRDAAPPARPPRSLSSSRGPAPSTPGSPPCSPAAAAFVLPFFPNGWPLVLGALAGAARAALAALRARARARRADPAAREHRPGTRGRLRRRRRGLVRALLGAPDRGFLFLAGPAARADRRARARCRSLVQRVGRPRAPGRDGRHGHARRGGLRLARAAGCCRSETSSRRSTLAETTAARRGRAARCSSALAAQPGLFLVAAILAAASLTVPLARAARPLGTRVLGLRLRRRVLLLPLAAGTVVSAPAVLPGDLARSPGRAAPELRLPSLRRAVRPAPRPAA